MITKLTKEQEARFSEFVDKWLKIGLRTEPLDHNETSKAYYTFQKEILNRPIAPVVILDGPAHAWIAVCVFSQGQVRSQVRSQVWSQVESQVESQVWSLIWPYWDAPFWSGWFSFYDFCQSALGLKLHEKFSILESCSSGVCWPIEAMCVISDSPSAIKMNGGVLHCETGPCVAYRDGTCCFALNGVPMKREHIETPAERIKPEAVLAEQNTDVRRELLRKVGVERMLAKLPHKVLDKRGNYETLSIDLGNGVSDARYLRMKNPSVGVWHLEGVAPECATVEQSLNWRNNQWFENADLLT